MILQLNPPIPVITPKGKGFAQLVIDYGPEYNLLWTVFLNNGECWTFDNKEIRSQENITFNRPAPTAKQEPILLNEENLVDFPL